MSCSRRKKGNDHLQPLLRVRVSASEIADLTEKRGAQVLARSLWVLKICRTSGPSLQRRLPHAARRS